MAIPVPYPTDQLIDQKTGIGYRRDLWARGSADYKHIQENFWGDALDAKYPAAKTNGTSAAVTFTEHNEDGYLELVSGTDSAGYAGQGMGMQWTGTRGVLAEFIVRTPSAVTTLKIEVGLSDADDDAGAVNVKSTPSHTATDYAVFVVDTTDDANIAFISYNGTTGVATQDIQAIAASTTYRFAVRIVGASVQGFINGKLVSGGTHVITAATKLTPWVFCQARAGSASRTLQWHKLDLLYPAY